MLRSVKQSRRSCGVLAILALAGCSGATPKLSPTTVARDGAILRVDLGVSGLGVSGLGVSGLGVSGLGVSGQGSVIVLVDDVPAHSIVIDAPGRLRAELPPLPRSGVVDVEIRFADGTSVTIVEGLEVAPSELEVRPRV
jgi:hypothetical protein